MGFGIDARFNRPVAVLAMRGELDLATEEHVGWAVAHAIDNGCHLVVLDLSDLSFMDCAGIGALVAAKRQLDHASGRLQLREVGPLAYRLLDLTGMAHVFGVEERSAALTGV